MPPAQTSGAQHPHPPASPEQVELDPAQHAASLIEVTLARASANGTLAVGNLELASATTTNGHFSARVSLLPDLVLAALFSAVLTWAARKIVGGLRAWNAKRRPPEDDA